MLRINKEIILLKLEILRLLNNNNQGKKKFLTGLSANVVMAFMFIFYSASLTRSFYKGNPLKVIVTSTVIVFLMIFWGNILYSNNSLFEKRELENLLPMPFTSLEIISSKILGIYVYNLGIVACTVIFPFLYVTYDNCSFPFTLFTILILLSLPIIPLCLSLLATAFLGKIFTNKIVRIIGGIIFFSIVIFFYIMLYFSNRSRRLNILAIIIEKLSKISLLKTFGLIFIEESYLNGLIFMGISILFFGLVSVFLSKNYLEIFYRKANKIKKSSNKALKMVTKNKSGSLFEKEIGLYFSYNNYILNTILGPILLLILGVAPLVTGMTNLQNMVDFDVEKLLTTNSILVVTAFAAMGQTTYCSLSIEGRNYYLMQTLPIKAWDVFKAKLKLGIIIISAPLIFTSLVLSLKFNLGFLAFLLLIVAAFSYSLFANLLGLIFDINTLNINWVNSREVVKGKFSALLIQLIIGLMVLISFLISNILFKNNRILSWLIIIIFVNIFNFVQIWYLSSKNLKM